MQDVYMDSQRLVNARPNDLLDMLKDHLLLHRVTQTTLVISVEQHEKLKQPLTTQT